MDYDTFARLIAVILEDKSSRVGSAENNQVNENEDEDEERYQKQFQRN